MQKMCLLWHNIFEPSYIMLFKFFTRHIHHISTIFNTKFVFVTFSIVIKIISIKACEGSNHEKLKMLDEVVHSILCIDLFLNVLVVLYETFTIDQVKNKVIINKILTFRKLL